MSVHYKFKSSLDYDTLTFDGLHISVGDLKKSIIQQKKIGKSSDFDLQITNAQTKEVYKEDETLIPKNSSVIVARIPITGANKKSWDRGDGTQQQLSNKTTDSSSDGATFDKLAKTADLTASNASEDDKIKAMMTQATQDYDPSKYMKIRGMTGPIPPNYLCYRCGKPGHWIKNCPTNTFEVKRSTGIPRSFMVTVEGPEVPGALLTNTGQFAVPVIDHEAYREGKKERPPFAKEPTPEKEEGPTIPDELLCTICRDLLSDAVLIPCCGNSYCDECVRQALLDSDEHECPTCQEKDISPDTLIPNRFLRTAVMNFKNETGYTKIKKVVRPPSPVAVPSPPLPEKQIENEPAPPPPEPEPVTTDDRPGTPVRDENPENTEETAPFEPVAEMEETMATIATPTTTVSTTNQSGFTISTITTRIPRQQYPTVVPPLPIFRPNRPPRMSINPFPEAPRGPPPPLRASGMQQMPRPFSPKHDPSHYHHHHHHHHSRHWYNPPVHPFGPAPPYGGLPPPRSGPAHMNHPMLPMQPMHMPHHYAPNQMAPPRGMPPRGPPPSGYSSQPPPPGSLPLGPPPFEQPPPPGIPLMPAQHGPGYDYYRDHKNVRDKGKNPFAEFERELMEYKADRSARSRSSRSSSRSFAPSRSSSRSRSPPISRSISRSSRSSSRSRSYSYSRSRSISISRSRSRSRSRSPYRSRARSRSRGRRYSPHYRRSSRSPFGRPRSPLRREYSPSYYNVYRYHQPPMNTNFSPDQRGRFYQPHSYRYDEYHHYNEHNRYDAQDQQFNPRYDETYHEKRRSWSPEEKDKAMKHENRKSLRPPDQPRREDDHVRPSKEKISERKRDPKRHRSKSKREKEHESTTKLKEGKSRKETNQNVQRNENLSKYERKSDEKELEMKNQKKIDSDLTEAKKKHKSKTKKSHETNKPKTKSDKNVEIASPSKEISKNSKNRDEEKELKPDPESKLKHVIKEADSTNVLADSTIEETNESKTKDDELKKIVTPEPDSAGEIGDGMAPEDEPIEEDEEEAQMEEEEEEGETFDQEDDEEDEEEEEEGELNAKDESEMEEKGGESVLIAHIPELSKWERDESDVDETVSPNAEIKEESPKMLPKDIVQRAEKAILLKPLKLSATDRNLKSIDRKSKSSSPLIKHTSGTGKEEKDVGLVAVVSDAPIRKEKIDSDQEKEKNLKIDKFKLDRSKFQEKNRYDESPERKNRIAEKSIPKSSWKSKNRKEKDELDENPKKSRDDETEPKKRKDETGKPRSEKRKSTIDESKFEPIYDETSDSDGEKSQKHDRSKRGASKSPERSIKKARKHETEEDDEKKANEIISVEFRRSLSASSSSSASPSSESPHKKDKSHKHKKTKHKKHRKHKHKHKKKKSHKNIKTSDKH